MMFNRFRTIIWLKWRLAVNQSRKAGSFQAVFQIIAAVMALSIAVSTVVGTMCASFWIMPMISPELLLFVWDILVVAFLIIVFFNIVVELQQTEVISLQNFLHLPVSPFHAFLLNFVGSFFNLTTLMFVPPMLGFALMHWVGYGWQALFAPVLFMAFFFMVMSFAYQIRSWISILVVDKRRQRTIIAVGTLLLVAISQVPVVWQLGFVRPGREKAKAKRVMVQAKFDEMAEQVEAGTLLQTEFDEAEKIRDDEKQRLRLERKRYLLDAVRNANVVIPLGWLPLAMQENARGNFALPFVCLFGMLFLTGFSLNASFKTTIRLYRGDIRQRKKPVATSSKRYSKRGPPSFGLPGRKFPFLSDSQSAIVGTTLAGYLRDPGTRMVIASPVVIVIALVCAAIFTPVENVPIGLRGLLGVGIGVMISIGLSGMLLNQFGFDRNGFRTFIFSPIPRRDILLAKSLAPLPICIVVIVAALIVLQICLPMRWSQLPASFLGFLSIYFMVCIYGNFLSIYVPYAIKPGTSQPQNLKAFIILVQMSVMLVLGVIVTPVALPFGIEYLLATFWGVRFPISLIVNGILFPCVFALFVWMTYVQGRLMEKREIKILEAVTIKGK